MIPRPYQIAGSDWLADRRHALLADQMRVGKTGQAILAAEKVLARRTLVLCPAIALPVWESAWAEWGATGRIEAYSYDYAIRHPEVVKGPWDLFIPDECHFSRNPEAKRTQLVWGKGGAAWNAQRTWALSGTPVVRHAGEIWAMATAFGYMKMSYELFVARYCTIDYLSQKPKGTKPEHADELNALLAKFMLRRTRKDVAPDLPEIAFNFLPLVGQPPEDAPFAGTDDEYLTHLERNAAHDADLRIQTALAKVHPLAENIIFAIENGLLPRTVVFGYHTEPMEILARVLTGRGLRVALITGQTPQKNRSLIQDGFKAGGYDVIVANLIAAGTAIDLSAARHAYVLETDYLPANLAQAAARLVNLNLTDPVTVDAAVWPGSNDDRMTRILTRRAAEIAKLY